MKLVIAVVLLCGMAMGQECITGGVTTKGWGCNSTTCACAPVSGSGNLILAAPPPAKRCAFDLKPQTILDHRPRKPKPQDEMFPQPLSNFTYGDLPYNPTRTVCPYERAIELFGEDRVTFKEIRPASPCTMACPDKITKRVLVDGESVYEERP